MDENRLPASRRDGDCFQAKLNEFDWFRRYADISE